MGYFQSCEVTNEKKGKKELDLIAIILRVTNAMPESSGRADYVFIFVFILLLLLFITLLYHFLITVRVDSILLLWSSHTSDISIKRNEEITYSLVPE